MAGILHNQWCGPAWRQERLDNERKMSHWMGPVIWIPEIRIAGAVYGRVQFLPKARKSPTATTTHTHTHTHSPNVIYTLLKPHHEPACVLSLKPLKTLPGPSTHSGRQMSRRLPALWSSPGEWIVSPGQAGTGLAGQEGRALCGASLRLGEEGHPFFFPHPHTNLGS